MFKNSILIRLIRLILLILFFMLLSVNTISQFLTCKDSKLFGQRRMLEMIRLMSNFPKSQNTLLSFLNNSTFNHNLFLTNMN